MSNVFCHRYYKSGKHQWDDSGQPFVLDDIKADDEGVESNVNAGNQGTEGGDDDDDLVEDDCDILHRM